ncbi:hypothetical protein V5O48_003665, partial [Marasmius crinis-equi]
MAEHRHLAEIDPEFAKLPRPPTAVGPIDLDAFRSNFATKVLPAMQAASKGLLPPESEYQVTDHLIEVQDGVKAPARVITPATQQEDGKFPLLFWLHAGGRSITISLHAKRKDNRLGYRFILGGLDMDDYFLRRLAVDHQIVVVNFDYSLAPEHPFPIPVDDSFAALKHIAANQEEFSADLSKGFIVSGQSAGANIAAVLAHLALKEPVFKQHPLTGQFLMYPLVVHPSAYPEKFASSLLSYNELTDVVGLTKGTMDSLWAFYKPEPSDPRASPLLFPSHGGLPPTYVQVAGMDPLRDEGLLYEKVLKEAGVKTKVDVYPGVPHGFHMINPQLEIAQKQSKDTKAG